MFSTGANMRTLLLGLLFCGGLLGQFGGQTIRPVTVAPSGACTANLGQLLGPGGTLYTCQSGFWGTVSGGGSGSGITSLTGDVTATGPGSAAATVNGIAGVPFCAGYTPASGQGLQYTTASSPNPCYTAAAVAPLPDILSESKAGGTLNTARQEYASLAANATLTLLNITPGSAGYLSHMFIAFTNSDANARSSSILKITVDGETNGATFNGRIPLFFAAEYCYNTVNYHSRWTGCQQNNSNNIGFYSYIPIPFSTSLKIELVNGSSTTTSTVFGLFTYQTGVSNTWPNTRKLRTSSGTLTNQTVNTVETLVNASSLNPGRLMGVYMSIDSFPNSATPAAAPLEGNVKMYIDGAGSPNFESPGTEDYFNWSNYFEGAGTVFGTAMANGTGFSFDQGFTGLQFSAAPTSVFTWNAYRFHIMDQVLFTNALKITWNCGDSSQVNFTGGVRLAYMVWYYTQ